MTNNMGTSTLVLWIIGVLHLFWTYYFDIVGYSEVCSIIVLLVLHHGIQKSLPLYIYFAVHYSG